LQCNNVTLLRNSPPYQFARDTVEIANIHAVFAHIAENMSG